MAEYYWEGSSSTAASTAGNWLLVGSHGLSTSSAVPATDDTVYFSARGTQKCVWDISDISQMIWEEGELRFKFALELSADVDVHNGIFLNGQITTTSGASRVITFDGAPAFRDSRYVMNGEFANPANELTYKFSYGSSEFLLDNGPHPIVLIHGGVFRPHFCQPHYFKDSTTIFKLQITSGTVAPSAEGRGRDRKKTFLITGTTADSFTCAINSLDFGNATFGLTGGSAGTPRVLPTTHGTTYGAGNFSFNVRHFRAYYPDKSSIGASVGHLKIEKGTILSVANLTIDEGCAIFGDVTGTCHPSIECSGKITVRGSFGNFVQVSDGVFRAANKTFLEPQVLNHWFGGTGLKTLGTAGQVIKVNSGATALEWGTASASTDIDALSALGGTGLHQTQDHFMFSDNGTEKKISFSNLEDAIFANVSGDATIAAGGALTIATDGVDIAMLSATGTASSSTFLRGDNSWVTPTDTNTTYSEATGSAEGLMSIAHHDKLDGIEASADVTDATNVTAAGALMDSEVTNLAFVKGLTGGISNGNVLVANAAVVDDDFLRVDGTQVEGRSAAEVKADLDLEAADIVTASLGAALTVVTLATSVTGFASGAYTIAPMANVVKDVTSGWDTSNYYFTVPAAGIYQIEWSASIRYISTSHAAVTRLQKDSGSGFGLLANGTTCNDSGAITNGTWTGQLASGDKIALYVYHNGGSGKNLIGDNVAANFTHMGIRMVGT